MVELELAGVPELLEAAGRIALRWFRTELDVVDKGGRAGFDPVTIADRQIEEIVRDGLSVQFPDHEIVGEEFGTTGTPGRYRWLIDPIDGTKAFITGSPLWGTLIGLLDRGQPVAGWIYQPYLEEMFVGIVGHGAWLERRGERFPLHTRHGVNLADAVMYCTTPTMFADGWERATFERLAGEVRLVRFGGDCYSYAQVAMGQVDLVLDSSLQPYDIVAPIAVIEAAGGVVSGLEEASAAAGGFVLTAASSELHDEILDLVEATSGPHPRRRERRR